MLTLEQLTALVDRDEIDTVIVAITDMQGRLQGKRFHARHFLDEVVKNGTEGCNYLLAVDVEMNTVDGYEMSSWARGYGDFAMTPDFGTLRRIPWHPGTAMVLADLGWLDHDHTPVLASPRQVLQRQLARLAEAGYRAYAGTELEFILYRDSYEDAFASNYHGLTPANVFNADYSLLQTARIEPMLRRLRNDMYGAGLTPESAKGECNLGQHEVAFRYAEALACCDNHVISRAKAERYFGDIPPGPPITKFDAWAPVSRRASASSCRTACRRPACTRPGSGRAGPRRTRTCSRSPAPSCLPARPRACSSGSSTKTRSRRQSTRRRSSSVSPASSASTRWPIPAAISQSWNRPSTRKWRDS